MYQSGIVELSFEEAENMGFTVGDHIFIEPNLQLEKQVYFKAYTIKLSDKKKDFEGRWLDQYIDFKKTIIAVQDFKISKKNLTDAKEVNLNKSLEMHLKKYFVNAHMSSGKQRSYFDLVIGNMNYVIEIKLAKALKKTGQMQKAIGQIDGYIEEVKNNKLILLVIGEKIDRQDRNILYIKNDVENKKDCKFYFLEAL